MARRLACVVAALIALVGARAHADPATYTFYRWGPIDANSQLYNASGYWTDGGHARRWNQGDGVALGNGSLDVARGWFAAKRAKEYDGDPTRYHGGGGLYVALDPIETLKYGDDLMVVEVVSTAGPRQFEKVSFRSDRWYGLLRAYDTGRYDELPAIWHYAERALVISHVPRADEGLAIHIRPPNEHDVIGMWQALREGTSPAKLAAKVDTISAALAGGKLAELPRWVFKRLLFDHLPAYVQETLGDRAELDAGEAKLLVAAVDAAGRELPARDARRRALERLYVRHAAEPALLDLDSPRSVEWSARLFSRLGSDQKLAIVDDLNERFNLGKANRVVAIAPGELGHLLHAMRRLPEAQSLRRVLRLALEDQVHEAGTSLHALASSFGSVRPATFRAELRRRMGELVERAGTERNLGRVEPVTAPRTFENLDNALELDLRAYLGDPGLTRELFAALLSAGDRAASAELRMVPVLEAVKILYLWPLAAGPRAALRKVVTARLARADAAELGAVRLEAFGRVQVDRGSFRNLGGDDLGAIVRGLAHDVPALREPMVRELTALGQVHLKYDPAVPAERLIGEIQRAGDDDELLARVRVGGRPATVAEVTAASARLRDDGVAIELVEPGDLRLGGARGAVSLDARGRVELRLARLEFGQTPSVAGLVELEAKAGALVRIGRSRGAARLEPRQLPRIRRALDRLADRALGDAGARAELAPAEPRALDHRLAAPARREARERR